MGGGIDQIVHRLIHRIFRDGAVVHTLGRELSTPQIVVFDPTRLRTGDTRAGCVTGLRRDPGPLKMAVAHGS
jgi:hypothetical protein